MTLLDSVEIDTQDPIGSVIWLHGLGADGHDFEQIVPELRLPDWLRLRFVFPHAPYRKVTINGGMTMRAWYDVLALERDGPQDEKGIRESGAHLLKLIEYEHAKGIPYHRILIAGFSQGGVIAVHTALRFEQRLAGLLAISTYLPLPESLGQEVFGNLKAQPVDLPIFVGHGSFDPVLPIEFGKYLYETVITGGYKADWYEYPMAHAVCADEIRDIRSWTLDVYSSG